MKKSYIVFAVLLAGMTIALPAANAEFSFESLWRRWVEMRQTIFRIQKSSITPTITSTTPEKAAVITAPSLVSRPSYRMVSVPSLTTTVSTANVFVKAIRPRESVHTITTDPIKIFQIGVKNTTQANANTFSEALLLDRATFTLFSNTGITEDVRDLELEIAGSTAQFDTNGNVTVQFQNARLSRGDSFDFDVFIRVKDPSTTPHVPGTLRLRLESISAVGESSHKSQRLRILGTPTSSQIVFDPVSTITGGSSFVSGNTYTSISGGTIAAGEKKYVLSANFSAYYDDLSIREITLRNTLTGSNIDPFIDAVRVIDLRTGQNVATGRFINGASKLTLSPRVFVGRSQQVRLGFEVTAANPIPSSSVDARFELGILPADLIVESKTTGRPLPDTNKNFSIDSSVFVVSQGRMTIAASAQQYPFAVNTSSPETVFRFTVNGGSNDVSLGRVSFDVFPSGCEFDGGSLDAGDVKLVRINGSQQNNESVTLTASGNKITVDFPREFYIYRNNTVEFGLQLQLNNIAGNDYNDLVSIRLSGDSVHQKGTLDTVRATGSNFIWSDLSARMHNTTTEDWFSGYLVSGLPSNNVIVKRFGN